MIADISLYHASLGHIKQYFDNDGGGIKDCYCWFGVGIKVTVKTDNWCYSGD
jgi:hypothetical protein